MDTPAVAYTDMSSESRWSGAAFDAKYGQLRRSVRRAYRARQPLQIVDEVVSRVEDILTRNAAPVLERPIFILGNFRSGTTFFEEVLTSHPSLGYFTYSTSAFPRSPRFADVMTRTLPGMMTQSATPHQPNMTVDGNTPFEAESIWRFCRNNLWTGAPSNVLDADFRDPSFEALFRRTVGKQLRLQKKQRFINKNPPNTVRLGFLSRVFPDARFIYLVRHPLRMLRSQLDMESAFRRMFPDGGHLDYGEAFSNLFLPKAKVFMRTGRHAEIAAAFGRDKALGIARSLVDVDEELQGMLERNRLQDRVLTIRYEDLMKNFEPEMRRVLGFIELDDAAGRALAIHKRASVDAGLVSRRSPLPSFSEEVMLAVQPLIEKFDYTAS